MMRTPDQGVILHGNDRFEGFCKDLSDLIAKKLNIVCKYILSSRVTHIYPEIFEFRSK